MNDIRNIIAAPQRMDPLQRQAVSHIGATFAFEHDVLPLRFENGTLTVALPAGRFQNGQPRPDLIAAISKEARGLPQDRIVFRQQDADQIRERLKLLYPRPAASVSEAARVWDQIIEESVKRNATDVYFQAYDDYGEVRLNIDSTVYASRVAARISLDLHDRLLGLIKHRGNVQPNNQNVPGDGRMTLLHDGRNLDIRIATLPLEHGHTRATIRFLNLAPTTRTLDSLGMSKKYLTFLSEQIAKPEFFIVIAGPVGAGKSTLAYAILLSMDREHKNIISLENPIEQRIDNVCQTPIDVDELQANEKAQMTFSMAARSLVRHNPDVEFIGEIRDSETMEQSVRAANTGVSLLSTVHCRNALHVVNRMIILNAKPREIAESVTMATSQRLISRLCPTCKIEATPSEVAKRIAHYFDVFMPEKVFTAKEGGCAACGELGTNGRIGTFEFLPFTLEFKEAIVKEASVHDLARTALRNGYRTMAVNAIEHLAAGIVSEASISERIILEETLDLVEMMQSSTVSHTPANAATEPSARATVGGSSSLPPTLNRRTAIPTRTAV